MFFGAQLIIRLNMCISYFSYRYTRPIAPKAGSYMKNLDEKFFITIAYGDSVAGKKLVPFFSIF